jgi:hypothetical protein
VSWDAYIEVRGNRYSVPDTLAGRRVSVRIALDGTFVVYDDETTGSMSPNREHRCADGWSRAVGGPTLGDDSSIR